MSKRRIAERRQISGPPDVFRAAEQLAQDAGHNNFSRIVQDLIVEAATRLYGRNWRDRIEEREEGQAA